jgi:hypothetical protein
MRALDMLMLATSLGLVCFAWAVAHREAARAEAAAPHRLGVRRGAWPQRTPVTSPSTSASSGVHARIALPFVSPSPTR